MPTLWAPAELPPRKPPGSVNNYTIRRASDGQLLKVPDFMIVRDYSAETKHMKKPADIHLGSCSENEEVCSHGWPWIRPEHVKVLSTTTQKGMQIFGWYACFSSKEDPSAKLLHRMPRVIVVSLTEWLERRPEYSSSSLLTSYPDAYDTVTEKDEKKYFHQLLTERCMITTLGYVGQLMKVHKTAESTGKRLRNGSLVGTMRQTKKRERDDCAICLEERVVGSSCCVKVCESCQDQVRGLCPVCDRGKLSAPWYCSSCGRLCQLEDFGFPCSVCAGPNTCRDCHAEYGVCDSCPETGM